MNQILSYEPLAGAKVDAITAELVGKFIKSHKAKLSPARANGYLRALGRCLAVAVDLGLIAKVPPLRPLAGRTREIICFVASAGAGILRGLPATPVGRSYFVS